MAQIYEGMFLIDNAVVRESWDTAKTIVLGTLEKHGATILSARRWDERRLCYPIKGKNRATFLLTYYTISGEEIPAMRRDFELNESVLRSLELSVDAIPETEAEFVTAEGAEDFKVPTPPDDDHIDFVEEPEEEYGDRRRRDDDRGSRDSHDGHGGRDGGSEGGAPKTDEAKKGDAKTEGESTETTETTKAAADAPAESDTKETVETTEEN